MPEDPRHGSSGYIERMLESIRQFPGAMWCILSGQDLTAQEFSALIENDKNWRNALRRKKIALETIADANHTFSSSPWREKVARQTCQWLLKKQP